jgi:hypothetical protein
MSGNNKDDKSGGFSFAREEIKRTRNSSANAVDAACVEFLLLGSATLHAPFCKRPPMRLSAPPCVLSLRKLQM